MFFPLTTFFGLVFSVLLLYIIYYLHIICILLIIIYYLHF